MREQTAAGPRAGACRLRRFGDGETALWAGPAGLWGIEIWNLGIQGRFVGRGACGLAGGAACPCGARCAPPPGDEMGLLFSRRRVPSCRKHASHTGERRLRLPCVRCLAPLGQGALPVCVFDAVCPAGQKRFRVGAPVLVGSRERVFCGAFCPSGNFPGAPGNGSCGARRHRFRLSGGDVRARHHGRRRALLPVKSSTSSYAPANAAIFPPSPPPPHPPPSRGENGGLCPHPPKGFDPLGIPLGGRQPFPRGSRPPTAAGGKPLLMGLPPSTPTYRPARTEPQHAGPLLVGRACVESEPTAPARRHCRLLIFGAFCCKMK